MNLNFYFHTFCGATRSFMKSLKSFLKPFDAPRRSVKIKVQVNFYFKVCAKSENQERTNFLYIFICFILGVE